MSKLSHLNTVENDDQYLISRSNPSLCPLCMCPLCPRPYVTVMDNVPGISVIFMKFKSGTLQNFRFRNIRPVQITKFWFHSVRSVLLKIPKTQLDFWFIDSLHIRGRIKLLRLSRTITISGCMFDSAGVVYYICLCVSPQGSQF